MNSTELASQLSSISDELSDIDPLASERMSKLSEEVKDPARLGELAAMNPDMIVNPYSIEDNAYLAYQNRPVFARYMEWARNFLVLLPIAITWIGLSVASNNYRLLIDQNENLVNRPFLLLWEQGFPGLAVNDSLTSFFHPTFSRLAFIDFVLLLIVVLLTIVIHLYRDVREPSAEHRAADLKRRVEDAMWELERIMAVERYRQEPAQAAIRVSEAVEGFDEHAQEFLSHLSFERERLAELAIRRERELGDLNLFSDGLNTGAKNLLLYGQDLRQVHDKLQVTFDQIADNGEKLSGLETSLLRSIESLDGNQIAAANINQALTARLQQSVQNLEAAMAQSVTTNHTTASAIDQLDRVAGLLLAGDESLRMALGNIQNNNQQIGEQFRIATENITKSSQEMGKTVASFDPVVNSLLHLNKSNQALLDQQEKNVNTTVQAISGLRETSQEFGKNMQYLLQNLAKSNEGLQAATAELSRNVRVTSDEATSATRNTGMLTNKLTDEVHRLNKAVSSYTERLDLIVSRINQNASSRDSMPRAAKIGIILAVIIASASSLGTFILIAQEFLP